jgi:protein-L-isoaspartate(D-aspartate) O-methyltransferase
VIALDLRRQCFADEIAALANLRTPGLVEALATVPRERFLPAGPWLVRTEADFGGPPRVTRDADPQHVYHNLAVAIDPSRQLFNGQPSLVAMLIDALGLAPGARVVHLGCGTGYYTALIARTVGARGRVTAIDVDGGLAAQARANLASMPWVAVHQGDGTAALEPADALLVNAGVTHPLAGWLEALRPGGRLIMPLTTSGIPGMGANIGKGVVVLIAREADAMTARVVTFVAIYSALSIRDRTAEARVGEALKRMPFPRLTAFRRDPHERSEECWLHADTWCLAGRR